MQNLIKSEMCSRLFIPTKSELKHIIEKNNAAPKDGLKSLVNPNRIPSINQIRIFNAV